MNGGELNVWESLLIRNIKGNRFSIRSMQRILAKRYALELSDVTEWDVLCAVSRLVDKLNPISLENFLVKCEEHDRWFKTVYKREPLKNEVLLHAVCSILKYTEGLNVVIPVEKTYRKV